MVGLLRRLFGRRVRHYITRDGIAGQAVCKCGYHNVWDYDLRKHFEQTGRIGK